MKKTILLINPPGFNVFSSEGGRHNIRATDLMAIPPMNLLYLASHLVRERSDVRIIVKDYANEDFVESDFRELLRVEQPFIVGITFFSTNLFQTYTIARIAKEERPDVPLIAGGPHTSLYPRETICQPFIDLLCEGEGEKTFAEVVARLIEGKPLTGIDNLWTKSDGAPIQPTSYKSPYEDLDEMPHTDQSYVGVERYHHPFLYNPGGLIVVATSRGCPFKCTFCNSAGKKPRMRSVRSIVDEIEAKVQRFGSRNVFLLDDTFNISPNRIEKFTEELRNRKLSVDWAFRGRAHGLDDKTIKAAREVGLNHISIGVEDFTEEGMRILHKGVTIEEIKAAFRNCNRYGVRTTANFIIGLPHNQNWEKQMGIYALIKEISPTSIQSFVLVLIPGSAMYDEAIAAGIVTPAVWRDQTIAPKADFSVPGWPGTMSIAEQFRFNSLLNRWFYFRPSYLIRQLFETRSWLEFELKTRVGFNLLETVISQRKGTS